MKKLIILCIVFMFTIALGAQEVIVEQNPDGTFRTTRGGYVTSGGHKTKKSADRAARKQNRQLKKIEKDKKKKK